MNKRLAYTTTPPLFGNRGFVHKLHARRWRQTLEYDGKISKRQEKEPKKKDEQIAG